MENIVKNCIKFNELDYIDNDELIKFMQLPVKEQEKEILDKEKEIEESAKEYEIRSERKTIREFKKGDYSLKHEVNGFEEEFYTIKKQEGVKTIYFPFFMPVVVKDYNSEKVDLSGDEYTDEQCKQILSDEIKVIEKYSK